MTAYAAFQTPTEWSLQEMEGRSEVKNNEKMQNHVTITKRQNAEIL